VRPRFDLAQFRVPELTGARRARLLIAIKVAHTDPL
jgi:hypothetical protein